MKRQLLSLVLLLVGTTTFAQIGGTKVYQFLNLPQSARVTALGGHLYAVADEDVNQAYANPATLNPSMSGQAAFNHSFHLADIANGHLAYARYVDKWDLTWHANMQYMSYGKFDLTDEFGNVNGTFKANEYAATVGAGKQIYDKVSVGVNLRFISSQFESYNSIGWTADAAAMYQDTASNFSAALVFKNIGSQFTAYQDQNYEGVPYNVHLSLAKKLRYLPLRLSLTYSYLNRWNVSYEDPNEENDLLFLGEEPTENRFGTSLDNFARHLSINGELLLGKFEGFKVRFGYNHLRKKELSVNNLRSLAGWSLGFGMRIKRFRLDYGHAFYHIGGGTNHLTFSTNISEFGNKLIK